ncbi:GNAT family N-acetyltransferase [Cohnella nanjingensis]|uniref:GNAT family N-acetyltransferase n=1 Tax=Cohnella nanjingensis TaxID=1387779 RepID=A0A7X0VFJ9_9BACL|nr:GNAT family protein [Cohnella nanjingensis]MBB6672145.1 GNAT family N-acetyltransferase [Cohnella nanjingensis]
MLETERLLIREFTMDDAEAVHRYASDPIVTQYTIWGPNTEEETRAYMKLMMEMREQQPRRGYEWAMTLRDGGALIGGCGLHVSEPAQGEIGYCLNPAYWRQGYASEAAEALLRFGFGTLGLHRIYATCRPGNIGSAKVMQHVGMQYEGRLREHMRHKGSWHDSFLYSILEQEYESGESRSPAKEISEAKELNS